jgi:hypothetical protein
MGTCTEGRRSRTPGGGVDDLVGPPRTGMAMVEARNFERAGGALSDA